MYLYLIFFSRLYQYRSSRGGGSPCGMLYLYLSIHHNIEAADGFNVDNDFARLCRSEYRLILCAEIRKVDTRSKLIISCCGLGERLCVVFCSNGFPLTSGVVPKCTLETLAAVETAFGKQRCHNAAVCKIASLMVYGFSVFASYTVEYRYGSCGGAVIVAPHHRFVVGVRTDNGYFLTFLQRQYAIAVLQQCDGLACHFKGQPAVFAALKHRGRYVAPVNKRWIVHFSKVKTALQQSYNVFVHFRFFYQTTVYSLRNTFIGIVETALHIGSCQCGTGSRVYGVAGHLVVCVNVCHGTAVADHKILEPPFIA